ncbi:MULTISPECIES: hypothetical protein [Methylobacterium]|uniref:hypothetical protein n=1 Tax=Methylobacterium TaxID=407 RepID=UPI0013EBAF37|nr:hypothetical protein [Methylobacterium sp. DB0501]NGM37641.1 hypothetical protein [Methylobacterium sp. DB0501]
MSGRVFGKEPAPSESVIDGDSVRCADGRDATVFTDVDHPGHDERQAPAGFTLLR